MRKPTLTPIELQNITSQSTHDLVHKFLNRFNTYKDFRVGDVLVSYRNSVAQENLDKVSQVCPIPKKFMVMHVDNNGVPWVKQISVRGGLGKTLYSLAIQFFIHPDIIYAIDPEQLDSILLGYKYDPRIEYKRMRNENPDYGKK